MFETRTGFLAARGIEVRALKFATAFGRGFDYYTETLWEVTASGLGAQNALGGGGRYDNLVENLGGRPTPGVGFGSGLNLLSSYAGQARDLQPWLAVAET